MDENTNTSGGHAVGTLSATDEDLPAQNFTYTIVGGADACGVDGTREIFARTDAVVLRDADEYPDARIRAELRFGRDATDRMVMVAANFQQMNRMMDAIGGPVPSVMDPLAAEMGSTATS